MKELWQRTFEFMRGNPMLWLPVVCAAVLSYCWAQLRVIILHDVLPSILQRHTLFGGMVPDVSHGRVAAFSILSFANTTFFEYLDVCCYVVALRWTATMLGRLVTATDGLRLSGETSAPTVARQTLWIAFVIYMFTLASFGIVMVPGIYVLVSAHRTALMSRLFLPLASVAVAFSALSYVVSPMALRMLSSTREIAIGVEERSMARKCSLIAGGAIILLSALQLSMRHVTYAGVSEKALRTLLWTVLSSLPYAPLFVALSFLVMQDTTATEVNGDGSVG